MTRTNPGPHMGTMIRNMRKEAGLSQKELAARMGLSQPAFSKFENQGDVRVATLYRIADACGADLQINYTV